MTRAADAVAGRRLAWDGCFNVRDLGGLPAAGGRTIRHGALVRADALDRLTAAGWRALEAHGVRTVLDLRNEDERHGDAAPRPAAIATVRVALDRIDDRAFWDRWSAGPVFGTPLYYRPHLDRFPESTACVVAAIARAVPGGVAFHCAGGRDRTGMIAAVVLSLVGVAPADIAADYALSRECEPALSTARGIDERTPPSTRSCARRARPPRRRCSSSWTGSTLEARLRAAGLADADLDALRTRILDSAPTPA